MPYIGRSRENPDGSVDYQLLIDHLTNVGIICNDFLLETRLVKSKNNNAGNTLGFLHDIGKYSEEFQSKITTNTKESVDHSTAGGQLANKIMGVYKGKQKLSREEEVFYMAMAYCGMGHHSGLMNYGNNNSKTSDLHNRLNKTIPSYKQYKDKVTGAQVTQKAGVYLNYITKQEGFQIQFFFRYMLSCLVDADRLDAQAFGTPLPEQNYRTLGELKNQFNDFMELKREEVKKKNLSGQALELMNIRNEILADCLVAAEQDKGLFTLTVPTGGGKTLSSMGFALDHGIKHGHKRIIYTIPFTSIIEQNANVYKDVFGEENVLEHHSNFENPYRGEEESERFKLAQSNWDSPIIVTTNVQFFETLFDHKTSKVRKLHNIANSIIVLDEVQTIPNHYILPCMNALAELITNYGCTVVLCSATQPEFDKNKLITYALPCTEIVTNPDKLFKQLKRTKEFFVGTKTIEALETVMTTEHQILCIVNTKRHATDLFEKVRAEAKEDEIFHLSTNMCPAHRKIVFATLRQRLKDKKPCKVISTQLIEAGVDIDFPVVYRSMTGLDSIMQAGGRCNREGLLPYGTVNVFSPEDTYRCKEYLGTIAAIGESILEEENTEFLKLATMSKYFRKLFDIADNNDKFNILPLCNQRGIDMQFPFGSIRQAFKMIDNQGVSVIIPYDSKARQLIQELEYVESVAGVLKQLTAYTINVTPMNLKHLMNEGVLKLIDDQIFVLENEMFYDTAVGLKTNLEVEDLIY